MAKDKSKEFLPTTLPYYGIAVVWILYAAMFDLYEVKHFLLVAVLSALVFIVLSIGCKTRDSEIMPEVKSEPKDMPTGNAELDSVISNGRQSLHEMREVKIKINNPKISEDVNRMEKAAQKIFDHVRDHPEKLHQIRHFLDYYLPTTLKLLNAYYSLNSTGISGKNIDATKERITKILAIVTSAFEAQLDKLFGSDALDISTDIAVLENMLRREGLIGEQMEAESAKDANGLNINLETLGGKR